MKDVGDELRSVRNSTCREIEVFRFWFGGFRV